MAYHECPDFEDFLLEARKRACTQVILAWREEYGQHPDPKAVRYERLRLVTVLAYVEGTILRCALDNQDRQTLKARLEAAGLTVEERCRNTV